jgi:hypothetical protein
MRRLIGSVASQNCAIYLGNSSVLFYKKTTLMKAFYLLTAALLFSVMLSAQPSRMYERTFEFIDGEMTGSSPEQSSMPDSLNIGKFMYGMNNLAVYNDTFYQVYSDAAEGALISDVFFRKSADGLTWSEPKEVSIDNTVGVDQAGISIGSSKGPTVFVVSWIEVVNGVGMLFMAYSDDYGNTFSPSVAVSQNPEAAYVTGQVVINNSYALYALWTRWDGGCWGSLYFRKSNSLGESWTDQQTIYSGGCYSSTPVVDVDGGNIIVAMYDDQFYTSNVRIVRSMDGGDTWGTTSQASNTAYPQGIYFPTIDIAPDGSTVYATYLYQNVGDANDQQRIEATSSPDFGETWGPVSTITDVPEISNTSQIYNQMIISTDVSANNVLYAVWSDPRLDLPNDQNFDTFLSWSTDGGATWSENIMVNQDASGKFQSYASVAVKTIGDIEHVVVVWVDNRCESFPISITQDGNWMTASQGDAYQWYFNGTEIPGAQWQQYEGLQSGNYTVEVTVGDCTSESEAFAFTYTGIASVDNNDALLLYPNPVDNELILFSGRVISSVLIYDSTGRMITAIPINAVTASIDVSVLAAGVYTAKAGSDVRSFIKK